MPKFICSKCGKSADFETPIFACECGGLYDLEFKAAKFDLNLIHSNLEIGLRNF